MKPTVVVVDDHTLLAEAFATVLGDRYQVVGTFDDPRAFLAVAAELRPHVALLDISMPTMSGLDVLRELRNVSPTTRVIFLTMNEDADVAAAAFRLGASGFLLKRSAASELLRAVRDVFDGRRFVTPLIATALVGSLAHGPTAREVATPLTERQRQVLKLLVEGQSMKEVASALNVSARTVAFHKYRIMQHLHATSTAALIRIAVREGLV